MNLYSRQEAHFDEESERVGGVMAAHAAIAVVNATAYWEKANLSDQLSQAMASRAVIEQAKGVIMATMGCSAEDAFEVLRQQSQAQNEKLRDIADAIVRRQKR